MSRPSHESTQQRRLRIARREVLRAGASGLGALALGDAFARDGAAGHAPRVQGAVGLHHTPRAKRVVWLFMAGAPSQLELFEPKPTLQKLDGEPLPASVAAGRRFAFIDPSRSKLLGTRRRFDRHGESGAPVSELLPHIGGVADKLCFLRGVQGKEINHGPAKLFMNTGHGLFGRPSCGAWSLYGLGSEADDLPGFVVLQSGPRGPRGGAPLWGNAFLPSTCSGTPFRASGDPVLDLGTPEGISDAGQADTIELIQRLDRLSARWMGERAIEDRVRTYELAHRMQSSTPDVIDLTSESNATLDLYGVDPAVPSFARNCLLARRLLQRGSRFVQLYHTDWDHHGDPHNHLGGPLEARCREVDRASAALVRDLESLGMLKDTLVVWGGEFGRTPLGEVRKELGRDHHVEAFTLWMAGGGVKAGHSHGETDEIGFAPVSGSMDVHDLHATMLHLLGVDHRRLTYRLQGRDFRLTDVHGRVIEDVIS